MTTIISESLQKSHRYTEYRNIITAMLAEGKSTGSQQSDALTHYSMLNATRMNRLEKTVVLSDKTAATLRKLKSHYTWLVISEGWCGDAAQIVPVIDKLAAASKNIDLRIVFKDENEPLMNLFLTNGSKSIPKLIVLNADNKVLADWGPRPKGASDLIKRHKAEKGIIDDVAKTELQMWYLHDKGASTIEEILQLMIDIDLEQQV
jgi:hypothetical protein